MFTIRLGPFGKPVRFLRRQIPPWNFITIHYAYFIFTCLLCAVILWGASTPDPDHPERSWLSFTNALFLAVSAMSEAGLNTVNLSELNTFQQFLLFLLILLGSAIWVSIFVLHVRRIAFERRFKEVLAQQRRGREERRPRSTSTGRTINFIRSINSGHSNDGVERAPITAEQEEGRGRDSRGKELNGTSDNVFTKLAPSTTRDSTPPARRGAPEMNGIDSTTGEAIASDQDDAGDAMAPPDSARAVAWNVNTRFERSGPETAYDGTPGAVRTRDREARGASSRKRRSNFFSVQGVGARPSAVINQLPHAEASTSFTRQEAEKLFGAHQMQRFRDLPAYIDSMTGWVSRNSQFHGLTLEERERLGGYEYRAVRYLSWIIPLYYILWQLLGCVGLGAWIANHRQSTAGNNGLNPWWVGAFNAVSAFNNSGMSLLDANMTAFQDSYYMLITMSFLILAGNTCFPVFLRLIVWSLWKCAAQLAERTHDDGWKERAFTLRFLLDHPRRCYTHLFPSQHTWWLLSSVVSLNGIDWAMFEILNIGNSALTLPTNLRVIDGLFQAFAVRSGGFYVVAIPTLRISLQVLYVIMMYISVYPVVITMRNSNVYEERSLGIYAEDVSEETNSDARKMAESSESNVPGGGVLRRAKTIRDHLLAGRGSGQEGNRDFVRHQLRAQLAHDIWWIVLASFVIMIIETDHFDKDPAAFSVFNYLFEIVSGYGCVGLSIGLPYAAYSFSGSWHILSKLILCAVMLRGRHRGLPVAIDRAVLLPGEEVMTGRAEDQDARLRMERSQSFQRRMEP